MIPPGADTVVVRYGDASIKSHSVQVSMEKRLVGNLRALLADRDISASVQRQWTRPLIRLVDESTAEAALDAATDAFGVVNASAAVTVDPDLDVIVETIRELAPMAYDDPEKTFAVSARRSGELDFTSKDVENEGGGAVFDAVSFEPTVDLDDPDVTFYAEVRDHEAYVFLEKRPGPGGLPLGTQSPVVALVSGGIDSPVAAFAMMKRGCPVIPVYVDLGDYGGPDHRARAMETVRRLTRYAPNFDLTTWVVPGGEAVDVLVDGMDRGRMLSWRRFIYAVGEAVAEETGAVGIVTGEAMGQKSSQTARNFGVTSRAVSLPVHRPLLTLDKAEITERARAIGTYRDSTIPAGCYRIAPDQVETSGTLDRLRQAEPEGLFVMASEAVADAERVPLAGHPAE